MSAEPMPIIDTFQITGLGSAYVVASPFQMNRERPEIIGRPVRLIGADGVELRGIVSGVERASVLGPIAQGETISLVMAWGKAVDANPYQRGQKR